MDALSTTDERQWNEAAQLEWLEKAYTVVGTFWAAWAVAALVGIYTLGNVKVPVFGEVTFTEVVVYTLYAFTLGIPVLLGIIFRHRKVQKTLTQRRLLPAPHFPILSNTGMPKSFRTLAFLGLVVLPIVSQEIAYAALYRDVCIAWKPRIWWKAGDYHFYLKKDELFTFPPKPEADRHYANWRFMRLELPAKGVVDVKQRAPRPQDNDGRPPEAKGYEPVQISAAPGFVPWAFRLSAHGCAVFAGWLLATRDHSLPGKLFVQLHALWANLRSRSRRRASPVAPPE